MHPRPFRSILRPICCRGAAAVIRKSMDRTLSFKLTAANRAAFFTSGLAGASWAPLIPFVQERFALDAKDLGILLWCAGLGSLCAMPAAGALVPRLGCRFCAAAGALILALCLVTLSQVQQLYVAAAALLCFGAGSVFVSVTANINAAFLEHLLHRPLMSGLHGIYSIGGFIGAALVTMLLGAACSPAAAAGVSAAGCVLMALFCANGLLPASRLKRRPGRAQAQQSQPLHRLTPAVVLIGMLCFVMFMTEGSMLDWSGIYLTTQRQFDLSHTGWGYAAFAAAMTIGRLAGDSLVARCGRRRVLTLGSVVIAAGFALVLTQKSVPGVLSGFLLIGLGAANIVPQLISYVSTLPQVSVSGAVTAVNALGFTGSLCGPALIGFAAQAAGLPLTFAFLALLVLGVGGCCFMLLRERRHHARGMMTPV